jgi:hypothetical protein
LFCFVLFCFVLFCFVLFCFVLLCFVLFFLYCFFVWFLTQDQVFRDADLSPTFAMQNNLILLGGPSQNMWTAKLESGFPRK